MGAPTWAPRVKGSDSNLKFLPDLFWGDARVKDSNSNEKV